MTEKELKRFEAKLVLDPETGCKNWKGAKSKDGYGQFKTSRRGNQKAKRVQAHREAYEHYVGVIPDGKELDHKCVNSGCSNHEHLHPVTHAENIALKVQRSREKKG